MNAVVLKINPLIVSLLLFIFAFMPDSFKIQQKKFSRVKEAYESKEQKVRKIFSGKGLSVSDCRIFFRAFKKEQELEVWARKNDTDSFLLIHTYEVCASSGGLGPKRRQGDGQVPEGFYHIDRFNPQSNFHLSLGVSYPNASDRILGNKGNLGGDIFIHGDCVTIGCLPLTDDMIKEVYLMAVEAKSAGQEKIPVHIFPCRMGEKEMIALQKDYADQPDLIRFWESIRPGYLRFEVSRQLPVFGIGTDGFYNFR